MSLTNDIMRSHNLSKVTVFREFVSRILNVQKHIDTPYQGDRFLREKLLEAVNIPRIKDTLKDRMPIKSHKLIKRVPNRLIDKPKTSGCTLACFKYDVDEEHGEVDGKAISAFGQRYGSDEKRRVKPFEPSERGRWKPRFISALDSRYQSGRLRDQRRLKSHLMQGIKGCFVCGQEDRADDKHYRDEVTVAMRKLKENQSKAFITVEDLTYITDSFFHENIDPNEAHISIEWEETQESEDETELIATCDLPYIEERRLDAAFIHGRSIHAINDDVSQAMNYFEDNFKVPQSFLGVRFDTFVKKTSIMSWVQYESYCTDFCTKNAMRPKTTREFIAIGRRKRAIGTAIMSIPFIELSHVIYVDYLLLED